MRHLDWKRMRDGRRWGAALAVATLSTAWPANGVAQPYFAEVPIGPGNDYDVYYGRSSIGASLGDYNNDGWPDRFLALMFSPEAVLLESEGHLRYGERTDLIRTVLPQKWRGAGTIFGDYDNDGDLDLFVTTGRYPDEQAGANVLLRNDRGTFVDVTSAAGLTDEDATDNATWLDYDRDGLIDLLVGNANFASPRGNRLYRNRGDGTFADATSAAGLDVALGTDGIPAGSNGGIVVGDFDDDGWPDLYLGVFNAPNRLFLNDGTGRFVDATTGEVAHDGAAFGAVSGDVDNDGIIDIFLGGGGGNSDIPESSRLYKNLGGATFLDVTAAAGLALPDMTWVISPNLVDVDNDGDLDLMINSSLQIQLLINDGRGRFTRVTESLSRESASATGDRGPGTVFADLDLDGYLDSVPTWGLHRGIPNGNGWLRVELVGSASNRNGIGARLVATTGDLRQLREIKGSVGGLGSGELVAHFGLGRRAVVDTLAIRWPSGKLDTLTDVAANQRIRVFEGRPGYHVVEPSRWTRDDTLLTGGDELSVTVHPALFEPEARITRVVADLSDVGGPPQVALVADGDGTYSLPPQTVVPLANGYRRVDIVIDQQTFLGPHWIRLSRRLTVLPAADLVVYDDGVLPGWRLAPATRTEVDPRATGTVTGGSAISASVRTLGGLRLEPDSPVSAVGYARLQFGFHPGDVEVDQVTVTIRGELTQTYELVGAPGEPTSLDPRERGWQLVTVELSADAGTIRGLSFSVNGTGTFYLDDIRLVTAAHDRKPPITAVVETQAGAAPGAFVLDQNCPNPFNPATTIRFALPVADEAVLNVYNVAGQRVATLTEGHHEAGAYVLRWDGRDDAGRALASGVYLYRLVAGERVQTRKLLLLR